jgi:hypothetical protein
MKDHLALTNDFWNLHGGSTRFCRSTYLESRLWQHFEVSIQASYRGCSGRRRFNPDKEQKELALIASAIHRALEEQDEVSDMRWYDYPPESPDWPFAERPD